MNFQLVILLAVAAAAFAIPIPDEEVPTLQKASEVLLEAATSVDGLIKSASSLVTVENGTSPAVGNATVESLPKVEIESELGKPTEGKLETTSTADDKIVEVPKSLPSVMAGIVPPVSEVRAEPKEGVEIGESKSTASSPDADEVEKKSEPKPTAEVPATTESISGSVEKNEDTPKTETAENKSTVKPAVAGDNKTEASVTPSTTDAKKTDKKDAKKEKHDPSSEEKKSDESAESKESEESNESKKN